jgi:hypothetical protein
MAGPASFITDLRRQTTAIINDSIGGERMRQLRAEGEAMNADQALRYALTAIERNLTPPHAEPQTLLTPVERT